MYSVLHGHTRECIWGLYGSGCWTELNKRPVMSPPGSESILEVNWFMPDLGIWGVYRKFTGSCLVTLGTPPRFNTRAIPPKPPQPCLSRMKYTFSCLTGRRRERSTQNPKSETLEVFKGLGLWICRLLGCSVHVSGS